MFGQSAVSWSDIVQMECLIGEDRIDLFSSGVSSSAAISRARNTYPVGGNFPGHMVRYISFCIAWEVLQHLRGRFSLNRAARIR